MKRRWFQLHLSTAVSLMFVAGGLMWLNIRPTTVSKLEAGIQWVETSFGWPLTYVTRSEGWDVVVANIYERRIPANLNNIAALFINITTAILAIFTVAGVCEWFIRRGERGR
jgi:hypothetical protein